MSKLSEDEKRAAQVLFRNIKDLRKQADIMDEALIFGLFKYKGKYSVGHLTDKCSYLHELEEELSKG